MIKTKRLFLALVMPHEVKSQIDEWRARHMETLRLKPIPFDNYHITLVFMGTIELSQVKELVAKLRQVKADNFKLTINKTCHWPEPKVMHLVPSIIPPKLINLQRTINKVVEECGLPSETRTYRPHISLYRKVTAQQFEDLELDGLPEPHLTIPIEQFALYECVSDEDGVHYEKMEEFELIGEYA